MNDLYLTSDVLPLVDNLENSKRMCIAMYELDPGEFISAPGLAWPATLKKTLVELDLITDIDMLLMIEKGISSSLCKSQ